MYVLWTGLIYNLPLTGALPQTPRFLKAWGLLKNINTRTNKNGELESSQEDDDIFSSPIRLSLDELLLCRARLRFTEPCIFL